MRQMGKHSYTPKGEEPGPGQKCGGRDSFCHIRWGGAGTATRVAPWLGLGVGTRGKRNLLGEEEVGEEALQAEVAA